MAEVGRQIRRAREMKGWNQATLAWHLGVSPSTVGRWEHGKAEPSILTMRRVASLLDKPLTFFIDGEGEV